MAHAHYGQLPIWRDATRLLVVLEEAVRGFPRYHKYTLGSDLRAQARQVCRLILRAYQAREYRIQELDRLTLAIDELKLLIQLGKETRAFASFAAFQPDNAWNVNFNNGNVNANNKANNNHVRLARGGK